MAQILQTPMILGHGDAVRAKFFREALAMQCQVGNWLIWLCTESGEAGRSPLEIQDGLDRHSLKLQDVYVEALRQAVKNPEVGESDLVEWTWLKTNKQRDLAIRLFTVQRSFEGSS